MWESEGISEHQRGMAFIPPLHVCNKLMIMEVISPITIPHTLDDNKGCSLLFYLCHIRPYLLHHPCVTAIWTYGDCNIKMSTPWGLWDAESWQQICSRISQELLNLSPDSTMHWKISISPLLLMWTEPCDHLSLLPSQCYQIDPFFLAYFSRITAT